jgi:hypothetical protein
MARTTAAAPQNPGWNTGLVEIFPRSGSCILPRAPNPQRGRKN